MNTITVTVSLTAKNLEILKQLTEDTIMPATKVLPAQVSEPERAKPLEKAKAAPVTKPLEKAKPAPVAKTDVRAIALKLSKAGKQAELKNIFADFNAEKLSDISESEYPALKTALEAVNIDG